MGDYFDRGTYGPEVVIYLLALKLKFPHDVFLLRGNHESRDMTSMFNFRDQMIEHYDAETYDVVMDLFDNIPVDFFFRTIWNCLTSSWITLPSIREFANFISSVGVMGCPASCFHFTIYRITGSTGAIGNA